MNTEQFPAADTAASYKDRKAGLVAFGIFEIILGGFCALAVPLMIVGTLFVRLNPATRDSVSMQTTVPGVLMYVVLAVLFIWLGVGSIRARRWARALILVGAWIWLVSGVAGLLFWLFFMPDFFAAMQQSAQLPPAVLAVMKAMVTAFLVVLYLLLPLAFILFYASRHVKATCEARDPQPRWTDRCPLPVLGLCLLYSGWLLGAFYIAAANCVVPAFGRLVSGPAGLAVLIAASIVLAYIVTGLYRLRPAAWWAAAGFTLVTGVSGALTFVQVSLLDYYAAVGLPEAQMAIMRQYYEAINPLSMMGMALLWTLAMLVYLAVVRRHFWTPCQGAVAGVSGG